VTVWASSRTENRRNGLVPFSGDVRIKGQRKTSSPTPLPQKKGNGWETRVEGEKVRPWKKFEYRSKKDGEKERRTFSCIGVKEQQRDNV